MALTTMKLTYVCTGYVPLLEVDPKIDYLIYDDNTQKEELYKFAQDLEARARKVIPICCAYCLYKGLNTPVLVYRDAKRIHDHLMAYSENKPSEWFELYANMKNGKSYISLWPKAEKMIERFRKQCPKPVPDDALVQVIQRHLLFFSDNSKGFNRMDLSEPIHIGFLDEKDFSSNNKDNMPMPMFIGPFDISNNSRINIKQKSE